MDQQQVQYPAELREWPVPVIALVGLPDLQSQLTEALLQDSMIDGTPSVRVLNIDTIDKAVVRKKYKERLRADLEGYNIEGILKANWLEKHKKRLPSALAVLFDFDDDPSWRDKETHICSQLEVLRYNNRSRNLKIMVVLVHSFHDRKQSFQPEVTRDERLSSLKKRADLESKNVFMLPWMDMRASAKRLCKIMTDLAVVWYKEEARRVKKYKEKVSKSAQPALFVRHHFKVGFFAEFRQEWKSALKYYSSSYALLKDLPRPDSKLTELKTVAEFINFKLSKIYMATNNVMEAVEQFRRHVQAWRGAIGPESRAYEHYAWLSRQYLVFGEMIENCPGASQSTDRRCHSGFYYQAAAAAAMKRRKAANQTLKGVNLPAQALALKDQLPANHFVSDLGSITYIGQPIYPEGLDATMASYVCESGLPHSTQIVELLTMAYEQYKLKKCSRMILNLASQMGEEYFQSQEYEVAKRFFDRIAITYRKEQWNSILTLILNRSLECATRLGLVRDVCEYSLELMTTKMDNSDADRVQIQDAVTQLAHTGKAKFGPDGTEITVDSSNMFDMDKDHPLATCKVKFMQPTVHLYQTISFQLKLQFNSPRPIKFNKLVVMFNESAYDLTKESTPENPLEFEPSKEREFMFTFTAQESKLIECMNIQLFFGNDPSTIVFRWKGAERPRVKSVVEGVSDLSSLTGDLGLNSPNKEDEAKDDPAMQYMCRIVEPEPKMQLELTHVPPALVAESYPMEVLMKTNDDHVTSGTLYLHWATGSSGETPTEDKIFFIDALGKQPLTDGVSIPEIKPQSEYKVTVYMVSPVQGELRIQVKVAYGTQMKYRTAREEIFHIPVQFPFKPTVEFVTDYVQESIAKPVSTYKMSQTTLRFTEPFLLHVDFQSMSPHPIWLVNALFVAKPRNPLEEKPVVELTAASCNDDEPTIVLRTGEVFTMCFQLKPNVVCHQITSPGDIILYWRRLEDQVVDSSISTFADYRKLLANAGSNDALSLKDCHIATSTVPVPRVQIEEAPLLVDLRTPHHSTVGEPFAVRVVVTNNTSLLQDITIVVETSDTFVHEGPRSVKHRLIPGRAECISCTMVGMKVGHYVLPRIEVTSERYGRVVMDSADFASRFVFVEPASVSKGNDDAAQADSGTLIEL